jgi:ABC-2 type transport system permease protein
LIRFLHLVQNENMKIYRRTGTWVMFGLLLVAIIGMAFLMKAHLSSQSEDDWKQSLMKENKSMEIQLRKEEILPHVKDELQKMIAINQYRIEKDIPPMEGTMWEFARDAGKTLIPLITLFTVIIGANSVAGEFSWGTIKLLLIRPVHRSKVLLSKYLATLLFSLVMLFSMFLLLLLVGGIVHGFDGWDLPHLYHDGEQVKEQSMPLHLATLFALGSVELVMMVTFSFMVSTVFRSSSMAIGLSIFLMFAGNQAVFILSKWDQDWIKYLLFANTDLSPYFGDGTPLVDGITLSFSLMVLGIHFLLFHLIAWWLFIKRDITA